MTPLWHHHVVSTTLMGGTAHSLEHTGSEVCLMQASMEPAHTCVHCEHAQESLVVGNADHLANHHLEITFLTACPLSVAKIQWCLLNNAVSLCASEHKTWTVGLKHASYQVHNVLWNGLRVVKDSKNAVTRSRHLRSSPNGLIAIWGLAKIDPVCALIDPSKDHTAH